MTPIVNGIKSHYNRELSFVYACLDEKSGQDVARQHGVEGYPVVLLLDSKGKRENIIRGVFPRPVLEGAIDQLLAEH